MALWCGPWPRTSSLASCNPFVLASADPCQHRFQDPWCYDMACSLYPLPSLFFLYFSRSMANFIHAPVLFLFLLFFIFASLSSSALTLPVSPISSFSTFSFCFSHEKDLTQHRFCSAWVRSRMEVLESSLLPPSASPPLLAEEVVVHTSTGETLTRPSPTPNTPLPPCPPLRACICGRDGSMSAWLATPDQQGACIFWRSWVMLRRMVCLLSFVTSLLFSLAIVSLFMLLILVYRTFADVHEYYYQEHTYLHSLYLWYQVPLPGRPQAPTTSTDVVISNHPRMSLFTQHISPILSPPFHVPSLSHPSSSPSLVVAETDLTIVWYDIWGLI